MTEKCVVNDVQPHQSITHSEMPTCTFSHSSADIVIGSTTLRELLFLSRMYIILCVSGLLDSTKIIVVSYQRSLLPLT